MRNLVLVLALSIPVIAAGSPPATAGCDAPYVGCLAACGNKATGGTSGGSPGVLRLHELPENVEHFAFILGVQKRTFRDQEQVNVDASYLMGELHDALEESGYVGHDLERYLVRLLFCLFADDTGIFEPRDIMLDLIEQRTAEDGSDTGQWLHSLMRTQ